MNVNSGNDQGGYNNFLTTNNRGFYRDDHNKSVKSNENLFELDNIFGSRENSEDKNLIFGIPLKQKNKY